MGKVRPSNIKILSRKLVQEYGNKFSIDFEDNKRFLEQLADMKSKPFRNRVAGYITRLMVIKHREKLESDFTH
ncbi:MAG: 30S ribosomal protein S17e [Candidatus Hodarchaeales archaeon]|jgi:small subunit ribosomal protein S17e